MELKISNNFHSEGKEMVKLQKQTVKSGVYPQSRESTANSSKVSGAWVSRKQVVTVECGSAKRQIEALNNRLRGKERIEASTSK
jgi:hypothetical protein